MVDHYYSGGGTPQTTGLAKLFLSLFLGGFPEGYEFVDITDGGYIQSGDPHIRFGGSGGSAELEIGLWEDFRIKFETTGITYWDGDSWEDLISGGGADPDAIHDNVDGEINAITVKGTPVSADIILIEDSVASWAKKKIAISSLPSGGETNTMSNEGTGNGVFWQKDGVNFELNNLKSENDRLTVSLDGTSHDIEFTVNEANIVHNNISGGTADDAHHPKNHDNTEHTTNYASELITITAGTGLSGGGTLEANRTINCDITQYTDALAVSAVATADDYIKNDANDVMNGDLTVNNLITAGNVDGVDVSDLKTAFDALSYYTQAQIDAMDIHAEAHILSTTGPHTGTLPWTQLDKTGSTLVDLQNRAHSNLSDAPTDAHHSEGHILSTTGPHTGTLPWAQVSKTGSAINDIADVVIDGTPANNEVLAWDTVTSKWINQTWVEAGLASTDHNHDTLYYTKTLLDAGALDGRYYIESEIDANTYTRAQVDAHNWTEADITDLDKYSQAQLNAGVLDGRYYTEGEIDAMDIHAQTHDNTYHSTNYLANVVEDTTPQLGGDLDLNSRGITHKLTAAVSLVNGDLCYMNGSGKMAKAQANAEATCDTLLAMCLDTIAADASGTFLIFGKYMTSGLTAGIEYWVSDTTAGAIISTRPNTAGDIIRHVGTSLSTTVLFFNPSHTYVEYV